MSWDTLVATFLGAVLALAIHYLGTRWQAQRDKAKASANSAMKALELLVRLHHAFEQRWPRRSPERTEKEEADIRELIYTLTLHAGLVDEPQVYQQVKQLRQMLFMAEFFADRADRRADDIAIMAIHGMQTCLTRHVQGEAFDPQYLGKDLQDLIDKWSEIIEAERRAASAVNDSNTR